MIWICSLLMALGAHAYIPETNYILEKVSQTHGKGIFEIELDITIKNDVESVSIKETWVVEDGESMAVTAQAGSFALQYIYNNGKREWLEDGKKGNSRISAEFFEPLFHARTQKGIEDILIAQKIVPPQFRKNRTRPRTVSQIKHSPETHVSFARLGDEPVYFMSGDLTSPTSPGIWIEQELFTIRKVRYPSNTELVASDYIELSNFLRFPRSRVVSYDNNTVEIRLIRANSITKNPNTTGRLSALTQSVTWGTSSLAPAIQSFYKRFR